ncbi:hypothetical protein ACIGW3_03025 [Streptomyces sp. NPDC053499]|uniref:hypothetical protein n=1 Tax=Streptomyces sp. NPDC053499 TaxID=3365707 RepID=UPI0037D73971
MDISFRYCHTGRSQTDGDALQKLLTKGALPMAVCAFRDPSGNMVRIQQRPEQ